MSDFPSTRTACGVSNALLINFPWSFCISLVYWQQPRVLRIGSLSWERERGAYTQEG